MSDESVFAREETGGASVPGKQQGAEPAANGTTLGVLCSRPPVPAESETLDEAAQDRSHLF